MDYAATVGAVATAVWAGAAVTVALYARRRRGRDRLRAGLLSAAFFALAIMSAMAITDPDLGPPGIPERTS